MTGRTSTPGVVVGIDGSPSAVDAAQWAVDEALEHDVPLRLVYVIEPNASTSPDTAEVALRDAVAAVQATGRPVLVETEILRGPAIPTLLTAARSAEMLCVGARGLRHATEGRMGSTAAALSSAAHCPVAIVRMHRSPDLRLRSVVIETDDSAAGGAVLRRGLAAARLRHAPAQVLTPAHRHGDVAAHWERRLDEWRRHYPDLVITPVTTREDPLAYLARHADSIQLLVTGRGRPGGITPLVNAPGNAALRDTDCSILVCEPHDAL